MTDAVVVVMVVSYTVVISDHFKIAFFSFHVCRVVLEKKTE